MTFETESGAVYEWDRAQSRIRRWRASTPGTERTGSGEWRPCESVGTLPDGRALIVWGRTGDVCHATTTSRVVRATDGD